MTHPTAATDAIDGAEWNSSLEARVPSDDAEEEWLGDEAVHPLTWVPAAGAAPTV